MIKPAKLIDSSANRGLVIADTNSLVTKGYYDYYMEVEGQDTSMTDTFDNLFVSILSKEKWDLILFVQPIALMSNDGFRDMTMADGRDPHQLCKLPGPIAPAIPRKHSDHFPRIRLPRQLRRSQEGDRCHLPSRLRSSL